MNIKQKFLELTQRTYPHETENDLFHLLPDSLLTDEFGNKYIQIGETNTMFTCHLDTARNPSNGQYVNINHVIEGDIIKTDGTTILGADDKAGCVILLYMIENKVPGLYYFFLGEEVGCIGSKKLAEKFKTNKLDYINKVVSFDRKNLNSVITHQSSIRCCSDKFAEALAEQLNICSKQVYDNDIIFEYKPDWTGICTDSIQFLSIYPECTNISVGYYEEHTVRERQDIKHLDKLAKTCCLIDWESLPVERDFTKKEYYSYGQSYQSHYGSRWSEEDYEYSNRSYSRYGSSYNNYSTALKDEKKYFIDRSFGSAYSSSITVENGSNKVKAVNLSYDRLNYEKSLIEELFYYLEVQYKALTWSGEKAIVCYDNSHVFTNVSRDELSEFLPELNFWEIEYERQIHEDLWDSPDWMW